VSRWPVVRLGEVCKILGGGTPSRKNEAYFSGHIPWVTVKDFKSFELFDTEDHITEEAINDSSTRMLPAGTVLLVTRVGVGKVALAKVPVAINQDIKAVIPTIELLDVDFLSWVLLSKSCDLERVSVGATVKGVTLDQVKSLYIPLPPLEEQRRIVDIFNHAAGIRRLRQQALDKTRALIPALFIDMFGDPASNPKGWPLAPLGELIIDGPQNGLYKHASYYGEGTPILRIDAFYDGIVTDICSLRRLRLPIEEIERYGLRHNDIVINRVNSPEYLGKSAIISELFEPTVFESNMMRFSIDQKVIQSRFLIQYLQTAFFKQQILSKAKHAINQSSINQQDVKSFYVIIPPLNLQDKFINLVDDLHSLITQQERHLAQAETLMQSLMARFFGGADTGGKPAADNASSPEENDFALAAEELEKYQE
jgi:type I restriction enzyme S subunit